jgi:hypothetical protein
MDMEVGPAGGCGARNHSSGFVGVEPIVGRQLAEVSAYIQKCKRPSLYREPSKALAEDRG